MGAHTRADWAEGLDLKIGEPAEYLFYVGCAGSFDDRNKKVSIATAKLLKEAGVDFTILGEMEACNGDPARRAGNEFMFQMMAEMNVDNMNSLGTLKVITACPHCFHTIGKEYEKYGGKYEVYHHSQILNELKQKEKLKIKDYGDKVTFHDPCYLGRIGGETEAPREAIGGNLIELKTANLGEIYLSCNANGAVSIRHDNVTKFTTKTDGVDVTGEVQCDSLDVDGDVDFDGGQLTFSASANTLDFADGAKAQFGDGDDLKIEHRSNNHSYITEGGSGNLYIGANSLFLTNSSNSEQYLNASPNGAVEIFHDNNKKFETTAYGVDVTGTTQSDTLIVTGVSTVASLIFSAGTNTNGVAYFDANGQVQSTVAPASGISTSNSILTTNASGVPIWTDTIDCGTF